jgi:rhodanese-related sulfurtransferase
MSKTYFFLIVLVVILGVGTLFIPEKKYTDELPPDQLFLKMNDPSRFVTTDQVARAIIDGDPNILIVDTRSADQFEAFNLPGSVNIPLEELIDSTGNIDERWEDYLGIEGMYIAFYSNGDVCADQAWVLCTRLGINDLFVMSGGLNRWVETILKPMPPEQTAPSEEFALYDFRKGASMYFGGGGAIEVEEQSAVPVTPVRKKKKQVISGGC